MQTQNNTATETRLDDISVTARKAVLTILGSHDLYKRGLRSYGEHAATCRTVYELFGAEATALISAAVDEALTSANIQNL